MVNQRQGSQTIFKPAALQRIQNGLCPVCQLPKSKWRRRTDWRCCSKDCTKRFWKEQVIVISWMDLKQKVHKRDGWKCVKCEKQPTRLIRKGYESVYDEVLSAEYKKEWEGVMYTVVDTLIADHIHPIALGGEEYDMENIQTLCVECDKKKTSKDLTEIAKLRDIERKQAKNMQLTEVTSADSSHV